MKMVRVNGAELAYDEAGTGPTVVLVHAGIADRRMWEHQFRTLSAGRRVIRYDWRGYGDSGDAAGEFAHHLDLLELMNTLQVDRAAMVGCSMGAAYALDASLAAPSRITRLVLVCPGLSGHEWPPEMMNQVRERVHSAIPADRLRQYRNRTAKRIDPTDVSAFAEAQVRFMVAGPERDRTALSPEIWEQAVSMCRRVFERLWTAPDSTEQELEPPAKGRLHEVTVPTLVVNGLSDVPQIQAVSDLLTKGIQGARRVDMPQTGHLPPLEHPAAFTSALMDFLAECR